MALPKKRPLPLNKRYPHQWSTRSVFYTPKGGRMEIEGPLPLEIGQLAFALLWTAKMTPQLREKLQAFYEELTKTAPKPTVLDAVDPSAPPTS
jgi:hypothetical protein